jgi:DUF4097 and DUF4098 domain-containing protein YvlB
MTIPYVSNRKWLSGFFWASLIILQSACVIVEGEFSFRGPEVTGNFQKIEKISGPADVEIVNGSGNTVVLGSSDGQVRVEGKIRVRAGDTKRGEEILAQVIQDPPIKRSGRTVVIGEMDQSWKEHANISIDFTVYMPRRGQLRSHEGSGDQTIQDIDGRVELASGSGDIEATNIGERLVARVGSGDIKLRDVRGDAELASGSGDIAGENLSGRVEAATGSGDIRLSFVGADLRAKTGSGSVVIREVKGNIRIHASSGDITVNSTLMPAAFWEIESVSGDVDFKLPSQSQFNLDATAKNGLVESDFPIPRVEETGSQQTMRGGIGKTDSRIYVRTSSGRIRIRKD